MQNMLQMAIQLYKFYFFEKIVGQFLFSRSTFFIMEDHGCILFPSMYPFPLFALPHTHTHTHTHTIELNVSFPFTCVGGIQTQVYIPIDPASKKTSVAEISTINCLPILVKISFGRNPIRNQHNLLII